ncbi:MAG: hypothetical protein R3F07_02205 [Opitutaceae bacterium]
MIPVTRTCLIALSVGWTGSLLTAQSGQDDEPPTNLVEWKIAHFSSDELRNGTSDDSRELQHDGLPNLLRYALGLSPREPAGTPIELEQVGNRVFVRYRNGMVADDASCLLESSEDLEEWNPVDDPSARTVSSDPSPFAWIEIDGLSNDQPRFFRLTAERFIRDRDADALDDDLELSWFATIVHGPADDPDQDGVSTADELSLGRNPHYGTVEDPALALRSTGLEIFTPHP